jgi:cell division transport system ATP-binding protein
MISFKQVHKRYPGGYEALKNVSFDIAEGEMVFITGHSGAGKSTLLKLIAGIERPNSGSVLVSNQNVGVLKDGALPYLRRNLGIIFQDHKLLFDRSVFDNVQLPLQICGFDHRESGKRVRAALDKVGLLKREKANPIACPVANSSCIARAIVNRRHPARDEPQAILIPLMRKRSCRSSSFRKSATLVFQPMMKVC